MKNLKAALNFVRAEEARAKRRLIDDLNEPISCLKYSTFDDKVDYIIRSSNMDRKHANMFVISHYIPT